MNMSTGFQNHARSTAADLLEKIESDPTLSPATVSAWRGWVEIICDAVDQDLRDLEDELRLSRGQNAPPRA
jgi:hypothetical protein